MQSETMKFDPATLGQRLIQLWRHVGQVAQGHQLVGGKVSFGCWRTYNGSILVRYTNDAVRLYQYEDFELKKTPAKTQRNGT